MKSVEKKHGLKAVLKYKDDYLFMLPFFIVFILFSVLPVVISMAFSFTYFKTFDSFNI